jgi:hypothetical protein
MWWLLALGCHIEDIDNDPLLTIASGSSETVNLARHPEYVTQLKVPQHPLITSGDTFVVTMVRAAQKRAAGVPQWESSGLHLRVPYYRQYKNPHPPGMTVTADGKRLSPSKEPAKNTWTLQDGKLVVRAKPKVAGAPPQVVITPGEAGEHQRQLHVQTSTASSDVDFVMRTQPLENDRRVGLYLPAPASLSMEVDVPAAPAFFDTRAWLLTPAVAEGLTSDGARVIVEVQGRRVAVHTLETPGETRITADISRWAGQSVTLTIETTSRENPEQDHVFLEEPVVYRPSKRPDRVLLTMVDTLRADRLGVYGNDRPASPAIDAWAGGAMVFDGVHAPAPWTLPSTRALLAGRQPEQWDQGPRFSDHLAAAGFATVALVSNIYISDRFGLQDGWTRHFSYPRKGADIARKGVAATLKRYPDRDLALFVHFMDPHTPWTEPKAYRLFDKDMDPALLSIPTTPKDMTAALETAEDPEAVRQYAFARYDNNVRRVDDAFGKILDLVGHDATVWLVADHGEAFWEEGYFSHGLGVSEAELVIPFIVSGPGVVAGRTGTSASLLDVMPTLAQRLGAPVTDFDGRSLSKALGGGELPSRATGFGRVLFGDSAWGAVYEGKKYVSRGPSETVVDLQTGELTEASMQEWRAHAAQGLDRPMTEVTRFIWQQGRSSTISDRSVSFLVEGDYKRAWGREHTMGTVHPLIAEPGRVFVQREGGRFAPREFFVEGLEDGKVTYTSNEGEWVGEAVAGTSIGPDAKRLTVDHSVVPAPLQTAAADRVLEASTEEELKALGYLD